MLPEEGLEDMADIDLSAPIPDDWNPVDDESEFDARDRDEDADG